MSNQASHNIISVWQTDQFLSFSTMINIGLMQARRPNLNFLCFLVIFLQRKNHIFLRKKIFTWETFVKWPEFSRFFLGEEEVTSQCKTSPVAYLRVKTFLLSSLLKKPAVEAKVPSSHFSLKHAYSKVHMAKDGWDLCGKRSYLQWPKEGAKRQFTRGDNGVKTPALKSLATKFGRFFFKLLGIYYLLKAVRLKFRIGQMQTLNTVYYC